MSNRQINIDDTTPVGLLHYTPLDKRYKKVSVIAAALAYTVLIAAGMLLLYIEDMWIFWSAEGVLAVVCAINLALLPKAYGYKGYAMREHDMSYRSGIIFPKITTVPYDRIQQVSRKQNPLSKFFGLYSVEIVNGAQELASITIPGLPEEKANQIKRFLTEKLKDKND